ncbi:MAG: hypothetical protein V3V19_07980 [Cocleimonas sp.]
MQSKYKKIFFLATLSFGLTACGGGNNNSDDGEKPVETNFSTSDFDKQIYITKEFEVIVLGSALFFNAGGSGTEYLDDEPSIRSDFNWDVSEGKLIIDNTSYTLTSKDGNKYSVRKGGANLVLYKAKPLSLSNLNGVTLSYTNAEGANGKCNSRTLKITGSTAVIKENCGDGNVTRDLMVTAVAGFENAIEFTEGDSTVIMLLTDGTIDEGNVTQVYSTNGKLDYVELEAIESVENEAF